MLDARRPYDKPSRQDQEEMLLQYDGTLLTDPRWVITRDLGVRLNGQSHSDCNVNLTPTLVTARGHRPRALAAGPYRV